MPGTVVLLADDAVVATRLGRLASEHALAVVAPDDVTGQPVLAVVDLDRPDGLDVIARWRALWPEALIAGYLGIPDRERWVAAQRAGCDLVVNRGALVARVRERLATADLPRARRFPLFEAADGAGRLGLVFRADETPVGPVAVYRVAGRLCAVADRCPHAGQSLCGGELDGAVVTCPGHGSQFDVRTGERLRGPADQEISAFRLVEEGGQVLLVLPA